MVGVGAGAGAGAGAAFAVSTGENCGGPVFFDGFVFWRAFLPVAWSLRSRSRRAGEPLLMFDAGDAAFLPPDGGRGILRKVLCTPWLPRPLLVRFRRRAGNPSVSVTLALYAGASTVTEASVLPHFSQARCHGIA